MSALPALLAEIDATDALTAHIRNIINRITANHRAARAELREGAAAINRVNRQTMSYPASSFDETMAALAKIRRELKGEATKRQYVRDIRLTFEQPPIPLRQWDWRAMHDGDDEEPSRHGWGRTPEEALANLKRVDADFEDSLTDEQERLWAEQP